METIESTNQTIFTRISSAINPSLLLIVSNCVPLVGVLLFRWSVLDTIVLYWMESAIIIVSTLVLLSLMPISAADRAGTPFNAKLLLVPIFLGVFSIFMAAHLFLIIFFLGDPDAGGVLWQLKEIFWNNTSIRWSIFSLLLSHSYSFAVYNIVSKKYLQPLQKSNLIDIMARPYKRIFTMQFAVLISAFAIVLLRLPQPMIVAMVIVKTYFDFKSHKQERVRDAAL